MCHPRERERDRQREREKQKMKKKVESIHRVEDIPAYKEAVCVLFLLFGVCACVRARARVCVCVRVRARVCVSS